MWEGPQCPDKTTKGLKSIAALRPVPHHELWRTTRALGITPDPDPDRVVYSRGAARCQPLAGVCFSTVAAAARGNGKSPATRGEIRIATTRSFPGPCQSRAAALGLHV